MSNFELDGVHEIAFKPLQIKAPEKRRKVRKWGRFLRHKKGSLRGAFLLRKKKDFGENSRFDK
jgi:hypothetical protein